MPQENYEVRYAYFGRYPRGSVLPDYVVKAAGDVADLVAREVVAPTAAAVNVDLAPPAPPAGDVPPEVLTAVADHRRLVADHARVTAERDLHAARAGGLERRVTALEAELAARVVELDRLRAAHAALQAELDAATAPDA